MPFSINGSTGISGLNGSAASPAIQGGDSDTGIFFGADTVSVATDGNPRLVVDANGNINIDSGGVYYDAANNRLGIGTSSPSSLLHLATGAGVSSELRFSNAANNWSVKTGTSTNSFSIVENQFGGIPLFIDSALRVGVGTTAPTEIVEISKSSPDPYNTIQTHLKLNNGAGNSGSGNRITFATGATQALVQAKINGANSNSGSDLEFYTHSTAGTPTTPRLIIDAAGRLLVGKSTPSTAGNPLLQVNGSVSKETKVGTILNGATISLFTADNGRAYLITTRQDDDVANRSTAHFLFTNWTGTGSRLVALATGTSWTVTMSGLTVQLTNTSTLNRAYTASILQLF